MNENWFENSLFPNSDTPSSDSQSSAFNSSAFDAVFDPADFEAEGENNNDIPPQPTTQNKTGVEADIIHRLMDLSPSSPLINFKGKKIPLPLASHLDVDALIRGTAFNGKLDNVQDVAVLEDIIKNAKKTFNRFGHNPLCVVAGYVRTKAVGAVNECLSPLLLIPVQIEKKGNDIVLKPQSAVKVTINQALIALLKRNNINMSFALDNSLLSADGFYSVDKLFTAFERLDTYNVFEDFGFVSGFDLALVDYQNAIMIKELENSSQAIQEHALVRALLGCGEYGQQDTLKTLDDSADPADSFTVFPKDEYQGAAVLSCKSGASFVLQGPPGTGKSQTISNMICALLGEGKRVLVVSEKLEALKVISKLLSGTQLKKYVANLSELKNTPDSLLNVLAGNCNVGVIEEDDCEKVSNKMKECRAVFANYQNNVHNSLKDSVGAVSKSLYDIIGLLVSGEAIPTALKRLFAYPLRVDDENYERIIKDANGVSIAVKELGDYGENTCWSAIKNVETSNSFVDGSTIILDGECHGENNVAGESSNKHYFDDPEMRGIRFRAAVKVITDGTTKAVENRISVTDATYAVFFFTGV